MAWCLPGGLHDYLIVVRYRLGEAAGRGQAPGWVGRGHPHALLSTGAFRGINASTAHSYSMGSPAQVMRLTAAVMDRPSRRLQDQFGHRFVGNIGVTGAGAPVLAPLRGTPG